MCGTDMQYWRRMIVLELYLLVSLAVAVDIVDFELSGQKNYDISKYCPMEFCTEGAHVLCNRYDPKLKLVVMGELCEDAKSVPITRELQQLLLNLVNQFRAALANGTETGYEGEELGKSYGTMLLEWDEDLAFFAKVWADQCTLRHDLCRATDKFHNPGQMVSVMRFSYPEWRLWVPTGERTFPDEHIHELTPKKVIYAIENMMREAYFKKDSVTKEMMVDVPKFNDREHLSPLAGYMTIINADATHMGCGLTAYVDYHALSQAMEEVLANSVLLVCNFSSNPQSGSKLVENPAPDSSKRCGCPPDTDEDENCLCIPRHKENDDRDKDLYGASKPEANVCDADDPACRSSVVILPIITVENAPSSELIKPQIDEDTRRIGYQHTNNIFHSSEDHSFEHGVFHPEILMPNEMEFQLRNMETRRSGDDVSNNHLDKQPMIADQKLPNNIHHHKESIFTRVSKFELPSLHKHNNHSDAKSTKKNISAGKGPASIQNIARAYVRKQRSENTKQVNPKLGIAGFNSTLPKNKFEIKNYKEEADHKLLKLLDNLEEEVKHVHLTNNIKQRINAKIRKIYGNIVDDHNKLLKSKVKKYSPSAKSSNYVMQNKFPSYDIDDDLLVLTALQKRQQNSLTQYDYPMYEHYDIIDYRDSPFDNFENSDDNDDERRDRYNYLDETNVNNYYYEEDLFKAKKRKYYQQKLDNIEKKIKGIRGYKYRNEKEGTGRSLRLFRPVLSHGPESRAVHVDSYLPQIKKYNYS